MSDTKRSVLSSNLANSMMGNFTSSWAPTNAELAAKHALEARKIAASHAIESKKLLSTDTTNLTIATGIVLMGFFLTKQGDGVIRCQVQGTGTNSQENAGTGRFEKRTV
jgi:hypothetical protein